MLSVMDSPVVSTRSNGERQQEWGCRVGQEAMEEEKNGVGRTTYSASQA